MKKLTTIALLFTMIGSMFLLSACSEEEEDLSSKIEEKVVAYQTDLEDSASTLTSTEAIRDYLSNWAKSKGIKYTVDDHDNVIMSVNASKEYREADPTVIICSYDAKQFANGIEPMAMALYIAKNNESTGKLDVIFTSESGHDQVFGQQVFQRQFQRILSQRRSEEYVVHKHRRQIFLYL